MHLLIKLCHARLGALACLHVAQCTMSETRANEISRRSSRMRAARGGEHAPQAGSTRHKQVRVIYICMLHAPLRVPLRAPLTSSEYWRKSRRALACLSARFTSFAEAAAAALAAPVSSLAFAAAAASSFALASLNSSAALAAFASLLAVLASACACALAAFAACFASTASFAAASSLAAFVSAAFCPAFAAAASFLALLRSSSSFWIWSRREVSCE